MIGEEKYLDTGVVGPWDDEARAEDACTELNRMESANRCALYYWVPRTGRDGWYAVQLNRDGHPWLSWEAYS